MSRQLSLLWCIGLCVLLLIVYLYGWRPVRTHITQQIVYPQLAAVNHQSYTLNEAGVALGITFTWRDINKTIQYRPQAALFFLISLMTLVIVAARLHWYLLLTGLHAVSTVCTALIMILSKDGWHTGFILVDLLGSYLVPVLSLALAAWVVAERRKD